MNLTKQLTEIGKLVATHGIKGEFKIWINEDIEMVGSLIGQQLFLQDINNNLDVYNVAKIYSIKNKVILKLFEITTIETAQKFVNQKVYVKTELKLVKQKISLIGFRVLSKKLVVGKIVDLMHNGAHELLKVEDEKHSYWVPNVPRYVKEIDWENKKIEATDLEMLR